MRSQLYSVFNHFKPLIETIDRLCRPAPGTTKTEIQEEVDYQRHKKIVVFYFIICFAMIIQILMDRISFTIGCIIMLACTANIFLLLVACRYGLSIFKTYFNVLVCLVGPFAMSISVEGGQRAWVATQLYPTVILFCTGSLRHFLFQAVFQLILLNTYYPSRMMNYVDMTLPADYVRSLTATSTSLNIVQAVIIVCIEASLKTAYGKAYIAEKKKEEFERQKIFLLSFSHELRNMINSLMGNVKLASLEKLTDRAKIFVQNADICAESLLHLINNILDSGKVEIGDLEINPAPTNIYDTMERIWRIYSEQIKAKNLLGYLNIQKNIPENLQIDQHRLMQIFFNLIGNAIKFTEQGSIKITVEWVNNNDSVAESNFLPYPFNERDDLDEGLFHKNQQFLMLNPGFLTMTPSKTHINLEALERSFESEKGILKVSVSDSGQGISEENTRKLFQKFSQVCVDPSKRKLGTGLGLFITKELCERMGGQIKVFSKPGSGSCFMFCIPAIPLPNDNSPRRKINNSEKKMRAMIVDDELLSRSILENFCSKLKVDVVNTAKNGLEAYNYYKECYYKGERLDLVTMDLTMPVMDGKTSAERIREFERELRIEPCLMIVISGNCSESEIAECTDRNGKIRANFFLKKPARIDEIAKVISRHVRQY